MPSVPDLLLLIPALTVFHAGLCSYRLKQLQKGDRRGACVHSVGDIVEDELESNLGKSLQIDEVPQPFKTFLEKFPCPRVTGTSVALEEDDDEPETALRLLFSEESIPLSGSMSSPLVSAMKGSREKQGIQPRKLSVSWAPDVYDPIPNLQSHAVKGKQKKSRKDRDKDNSYKKNGKNHSKGGGGGGVKYKKQSRKYGSRSDKCYMIDASNRLDPPSSDLGEFHVLSPDYFTFWSLRHPDPLVNK